MFFFDCASLCFAQSMNPSLSLYALGGGICFCILSAIATKYRGEDIAPKHLLRDSAAGALFTAFVLFLVPDMFPPIGLTDAITTIKMTGGALAAVAASATPSLSNSKSDENDSSFESNIIKYDDYDLQVGYPKKRPL